MVTLAVNVQSGFSSGWGWWAVEGITAIVHFLIIPKHTLLTLYLSYLQQNGTIRNLLTIQYSILGDYLPCVLPYYIVDCVMEAKFVTLFKGHCVVSAYLPHRRNFLQGTSPTPLEISIKLKLFALREVPSPWKFVSLVWAEYIYFFGTVPVSCSACISNELLTL